MTAGRTLSLILVAAASVAAVALWFSASAVVPALKSQEGLDDFTASLFSSAIQIGFVCGTVASAILGLADRLDMRRFFAVSTVIAASANAAILLFEPGSPVVIAMRFVTGVCMAGIYPVAMKIVTTWAKGDIGLLVGLVTGAVTLGSAVPHLFNALAGIDWQATLIAASLSAYSAAAMIMFVGIGPNLGKSPPFDPHLALQAWRIKSLRFANIGYLGHMWELYAMWVWVGVFLYASFKLSMADQTALVYASLGTFGAVGMGALGCVVAGLAADRLGRTTITIASMAVSGACSLVVGFLFGASPILLVGLCLIWGFAIVADSGQFSASVAELSDPSLIGTMLTVQTGAGFLLTLATIHLIPPLVEMVTWRYAFAALALGPMVGIWGMVRLRGMPESLKLANGRR